MEEELEAFVWHGTEEEPVEVLSEDFLEAIADGRDIDSKHYRPIRQEGG